MTADVKSIDTGIFFPDIPIVNPLPINPTRVGQQLRFPFPVRYTHYYVNRYPTFT